ncbi:AraC family transcriptional regulator [Clostridium sartagoforme AAU1]|uniref:AraC family transcriptional regulator n=1 Tax=Clostridium sartagoforme AAU1 TaxID=1202534 RepID=R9CF87_9CLOT|nr:AraC family transcriptional regulator [Clostridium sartagoforme AAU1]KLE15778.1 hypothetical protein AAT22_09555 [Clostridium sp. C8]
MSESLDYNDAIEICIEFIEENIKNELTYAVFTTPPINTSTEAGNNDFANVIKKTWKYIFEEWFKDSGYVFDETKLDFEYYDERCHPVIDTVMDIYVPILKREI